MELGVVRTNPKPRRHGLQDRISTDLMRQGLAEHVVDGCSAQLPPQSRLCPCVHRAERGLDAASDRTPLIRFGVMHPEQRPVLDCVEHRKKADLVRPAGQAPARPRAAPHLH
jgi:hypothetical protein